MAAWIKMPLGMEVGLGPGDFLLHEDPVPPSQKGAEPPNFRPCSLWPNGWMDQDDTWHGGRPQPRRLCVRWGSSPFPKRGWSPPSPISADFYCGQTARCIKMPLGMEVDVRWGPSPPPKFSAHVYYSYRYCDFLRTLHSRYWFVQVQVPVFYAFYFRNKSLIVLRLPI